MGSPQDACFWSRILAGNEKMCNFSNLNTRNQCSLSRQHSEPVIKRGRLKHDEIYWVL